MSISIPLKQNVLKMARLRRPCVKCGEYFTPFGKFCTVCNKCNHYKKNKKHPYPIWIKAETIKHLKKIKRMKNEI